MTINATPNPNGEAPAASLRPGDSLRLGDGPTRWTVEAVNALNGSASLLAKLDDPRRRPRRRRFTFTAIDALGIFDLQRGPYPLDGEEPGA